MGWKARRTGVSLSAVESHTAVRADAARERELGERFVHALGYAARAHEGQIRGKDGQPYVAHLLRVCGLVIQDGGSEDEAIAALLHDVVEDQGGLERLADVRERFGEVVAAIVDECTDSYGDPRPPWRERKQAYLVELEDASRGALLVSLADKLDNVRTIVRACEIEGDAFWDRSDREPADLLWYYGELASEFARLRPGPLCHDLGRAVSELEAITSGGAESDG